MDFFRRRQKKDKTSNGPYHGLKVLVPEPGSSGPEPVVDIVFVHGLNGDCIKTWKHDDAEVPWIKDKRFLGDLHDRARIMTFGYNANLSENTGSCRVIDHASNLLEQLCARRVKCKGRPLVFVAHSLGGLVVKRALILCPVSDRFADIQSTAGGLIFMGTRHEGYGRSSLVQTIQNIASFFKLGQHRSSLIRELESYSVTTMDINHYFMQNPSRSREIVCFYDTLPTRLPHGEQRIVKKGLAVINGNGARNIGMACKQQELCKFKSPEEDRFESIFWPQFEMVVENAIRNLKVQQKINEQARETEEKLRSLPHPGRIILCS